METLFGNMIVENTKAWKEFNQEITDIIRMPPEKQTPMLKFLVNTIKSNKGGT